MDDGDWDRVITFAEGNNNVDAIGQFGVGFFSVFAYSERPMIQSGKYCLAFVWQNGKSLTTFRDELPSDQQSSLTSIILPMRDKYILEINDQSTDSRAAKSRKDDSTNEIIPIIDLLTLKAYFMKVLSFTRHIHKISIEINNTVVFQATKTKRFLPSMQITLPRRSKERNLFSLKSFVQTEQIFQIGDGSSITLNHIDVEAGVDIDEDFHRQLQGVLKKRLPPMIHIEFLYPSKQVNSLQGGKDEPSSNLASLEKLVPMRCHEGRLIPAGQIFIGLSTHQTTGIGMHVFTHLVPTIERENVDLQDPYVSIWNEALLTWVGSVVRLIYDRAMLDTIENESKEIRQQMNAVLSMFSFQATVPNNNIGL